MKCDDDERSTRSNSGTYVVSASAASKDLRIERIENEYGTNTIGVGGQDV